MHRLTIVLLLALWGSSTPAQQSASHKLEEHVFNAGGHPASGVAPASASHRVALGSLGEPIARALLSGASHRSSGGFLAAYRPPGEVADLRFTLPTTLVWDPEPSAGRYNLYRAVLSTIGGLTYGACAQENLAAATANDATPVPAGSGLFFLVTVENRLHEEGTKGYRSTGAERTGTACP